MSTISIALCVYNGADFLDEQLKSLMAQTRLPDELIVCDDCSTDSSIAIVENFTRSAPFRVKLNVNETPLGYCRNFEQAVSLCSGEIVALCDQDDVWLPSKLSTCVKLFQEDTELGLVFSDAELVDENLRPLGKKLWDYTFPLAARKKFQRGLALQVLSRQNVITGATMAFRSQYWKACSPIPAIEGMIHDYWIALVIASHAKLAFVPEPLIKYRQHAGQQIGLPLPWRPGPEYSETIALIQKLVERLDQLKEAARKGEYALSSAKDNVTGRDPGSRLYEALAAHQIHILERRAHYEARLKLPHEQWRRIPAVLRELNTGRYSRHSRGLLSALKDCFVINNPLSSHR